MLGLCFFLFLWAVTDFFSSHGIVVAVLSFVRTISSSQTGGREDASRLFQKNRYGLTPGGDYSYYPDLPGVSSSPVRHQKIRRGSRVEGKWDPQSPIGRAAAAYGRKKKDAKRPLTDFDFEQYFFAALADERPERSLYAHTFCANEMRKQGRPDLSAKIVENLLRRNLPVSEEIVGTTMKAIADKGLGKAAMQFMRALMAQQKMPVGDGIAWLAMAACRNAPEGALWKEALSIFANVSSHRFVDARLLCEVLDLCSRAPEGAQWQEAEKIFQKALRSRRKFRVEGRVVEMMARCYARANEQTTHRLQKEETEDDMQSDESMQCPPNPPLSDRALALLRQLPEGEKPDTPFYGPARRGRLETYVIRALAREPRGGGRWEECLWLLGEMEKDGSPMLNNYLSCAIACSRAPEKNLWEEAVRVFERGRQRLQVAPTPHEFATMVQILLEASEDSGSITTQFPEGPFEGMRCLEIAERYLLEWSHIWGFKGSHHAYVTCVILWSHPFWEGKRAGKLLQVFKARCAQASPHKAKFWSDLDNSMLSLFLDAAQKGCSTRESATLAALLPVVLERKSRYGTPPDGVLFEKIFNFMYRRLPPSGRNLPDAQGYQHALEVYRRIKSGEIGSWPPPIEVFRSLSVLLARRASPPDWRSCVLLLDDLSACGVWDAQTVTNTMQACAGARRWKETVRLFEDLRMRDPVGVTSQTFVALLTGLAANPGEESPPARHVLLAEEFFVRALDLVLPEKKGLLNVKEGFRKCVKGISSQAGVAPVESLEAMGRVVSHIRSCALPLSLQEGGEALGLFPVPDQIPEEFWSRWDDLRGQIRELILTEFEVSDCYQEAVRRLKAPSPFPNQRGSPIIPEASERLRSLLVTNPDGGASLERQPGWSPLVSLYSPESVQRVRERLLVAVEDEAQNLVSQSAPKSLRLPRYPYLPNSAGWDRTEAKVVRYDPNSSSPAVPASSSLTRPASPSFVPSEKAVKPTHRDTPSRLEVDREGVRRGGERKIDGLIWGGGKVEEEMDFPPEKGQGESERVLRESRGRDSGDEFAKEEDIDGEGEFDESVIEQVLEEGTSDALGSSSGSLLKRKYEFDHLRGVWEEGEEGWGVEGDETGPGFLLADRDEAEGHVDFWSSKKMHSDESGLIEADEDEETEFEEDEYQEDEREEEGEEELSEWGESTELWPQGWPMAASSAPQSEQDPSLPASGLKEGKGVGRQTISFQTSEENKKNQQQNKKSTEVTEQRTQASNF
uniref:Pentacotripeptide-repeat region of PRORP domain-containing protein n=1 Tax=Chromera velia CCMP2878 TaxID=1169474 RepID=A0A0G4G7W4_9ALVE|eukprot:Cvel_4315.t1-p1 / transcript=Cvel_4315.t1 / gene=Cvel_4315 / organism=Chromera_velia_CCMP2878 / gene_product=hypothetical protein / transcript_product=hypothetical protein / location=Cvel_scaffold187:28792-32523(+) / protein_length=1244 / sequence_SO=supercontig / SO=protein_coding / is_pseudo=false